MIGPSSRRAALVWRLRRAIDWLCARETALALALTLAVLAFAVARSALFGSEAQGHENEEIAQAIVEGRGFSKPLLWRFVIPEPARASYVPERYEVSAWQEPLPAYLFAGALVLLGERAHLAMSLVNAAALALTVWLTFCIGRRLPLPGVGLAAALLLALQPLNHRIATGWLGNTTLGALALTLVVLATLRCIESPSTRRALELGLAIGVGALVHAAALVFLPIVLGALLVLPKAPLPRRAGSALVTTLVACLVLTPWTVRNYAVFGELVLVRNGTGFNAYLGNRGLAEAAAELAHGARPGLREIAATWAPMFDSGPDSTRLSDRFAAEVVAAEQPQWASYNEAEIDKICRERAVAFMLANPMTVLMLATVKLQSFLFPARLKLHLPLAGATVLALLGLIVLRRSPEAWLIALFLAAGTVLFVVITAPHYARYRLPFEPLVSVLAGAAVAWIAARLVASDTLRSRRGAAAGSRPAG